MKRLTFFLTLLIAFGTLNGCGSIGRVRPAPQSAFMTNFSLGSLIVANEQHLIAKQTVSSGQESSSPEGFFQAQEVAILQVETTNIAVFMAAIRTDIEAALTQSGAKIDGRGGDHQGASDGSVNLTSFSFRYSQGNADGVINVWGARGEGTTYNLIVLITES